jgi:hypothetical protein
MGEEMIGGLAPPPPSAPPMLSTALFVIQYWYMESKCIAYPVLYIKIAGTIGRRAATLNHVVM